MAMYGQVQEFKFDSESITVYIKCIQLLIIANDISAASTHAAQPSGTHTRVALRCFGSQIELSPVLPLLYHMFGLC